MRVSTILLALLTLSLGYQVVQIWQKVQITKNGEKLQGTLVDAVGGIEGKKKYSFPIVEYRYREETYQKRMLEPLFQEKNENLPQVAIMVSRNHPRRILFLNQLSVIHYRDQILIHALGILLLTFLRMGFGI